MHLTSHRRSRLLSRALSHHDPARDFRLSPAAATSSPSALDHVDPHAFETVAAQLAATGRGCSLPICTPCTRGVVTLESLTQSRKKTRGSAVPALRSNGFGRWTACLVALLPSRVPAGHKNQLGTSAPERRTPPAASCPMWPWTAGSTRFRVARNEIAKVDDGCERVGRGRDLIYAMTRIVLRSRSVGSGSVIPASKPVRR
jgi:hypothetical protein